MSQVQSFVTGNVFQILVQVGDTVEPEQEVVIVESMKMEIQITTSHTGVVKEIHVKEGELVQEGDVLITLE